MNIIFCYWKSICESGMTRALEKLGHSVTIFDKNFEDKDLDRKYIKDFSDFLSIHKYVDFVFTVNFIPIIAKVCQIYNIPYLSWTVDSPSLTLYSSSLGFPTSNAFLFDKCLYKQYANFYPDNVFYLPLGADIDFYNQISLSPEDHQKYDCDISFVGTFHTAYCIYDQIKPLLPEHMIGYIDGLIHAQSLVYGYYFIKDAIDDKWAEEFKSYTNWELLPDYHEDPRSIIADQYIGSKCTQYERIKTLSEISKYFSMDLYTTEETSMLPHINNRGIADTVTMMPKIFKCSKINLNMTARTIKSGIPQRIFDIMGVGGFTISNYQPEIPEYFTPNEDIVLYESIPDLLEKIDYYLKHDDERKQIAKNGYNKIKKYNTYEHRFKQMIDTLIHYKL